MTINACPSYTWNNGYEGQALDGLTATEIIRELGGGLSALVILAMAWWIWMQQRRINDLTDKFIAQNGENIASMIKLTTAIRERRPVDE